MTHSRLDDLCQSRSIVLSSVLAVPVNLRMPRADAVSDSEMIGTVSKSWSCISSKSMRSAMMPRARSGLVLAYMSCRPAPLAKDWWPTAFMILESARTPSSSFS